MRKEIKPSVSRPPDFDAFWEKTSKELSQVDADIQTRLAPGDIEEDLVHEYVSFKSFANMRIHGYLIRSKDETPRPLVIHSHGYLGQVEPMWEWAQAGVNVLGIDVRGFGLSQDALEDISPYGYIMTGIESPERHVLRGAVCDYIRAMEVGMSIFAENRTKLVAYGKSFSGALAIMAESLSQKSDLLVVGTPTFGWSEGRFFFAEYGSGKEVNLYLKERHEETEDVMAVLRYFDTVNFAANIKCSTIVGVGLQDSVVPAETVYAIANHLSGPCEVMEFPMSHTRSVEEQKAWQEFEDAWIKVALRKLE